MSNEEPTPTELNATEAIPAEAIPTEATEPISTEPMVAAPAAAAAPVRNPKVTLLATAGISLALGLAAGVAGAHLASDGPPGGDRGVQRAQPQQQGQDGAQTQRPDWSAGGPGGSAPTGGQSSTGNGSSGQSGGS